MSTRDDKDHSQPRTDRPGAGVWMCPTCRRACDVSDGVRCEQCGVACEIDGRIHDFWDMTPRVPFGLYDVLNSLNVGHSEGAEGVTPTWRVRRAMRAVEAWAGGGASLEIGGGDGAMAPFLEANFESSYSLDVARPFLVKTAAVTTSQILVVGDALFLPFADRSMDVVVCMEVMEHLLAPIQFLWEVRRVLKPGGMCYLTVPYEGALRSAYRRALVRLGALPWPEDTHVNFFHPTAIRKMAVRCGLEVRSVSTHGSRYSPAELRQRPRRLPNMVIEALPGMRGMIEAVLTPAENPDRYWRLFEKQIGRP